MKLKNLKFSFGKTNLFKEGIIQNLFFHTTTKMKIRQRFVERPTKEGAKEMILSEQQKQIKEDEKFWLKNAEKNPYEKMIKRLDSDRIDYLQKIKELSNLPHIKEYNKELHKALDHIGVLWLTDERSNLFFFFFFFFVFYFYFFLFFLIFIYFNFLIDFIFNFIFIFFLFLYFYFNLLIYFIFNLF